MVEACRKGAGWNRPISSRSPVCMMNSSADIDLETIKYIVRLVSRKRIATTVITVVVLAVFWPWLGNPFAYTKLKDSVRTSIPVAAIFGGPCETRKDNVIFRDPGPSCYRFDEPREFQGIWLYEFEGSSFIEHAKVVPKVRPPYRSTAWLVYNPSKLGPATMAEQYDKKLECYPIHAFFIRFIGRRNPYGAGHMGGFNSEIWVDWMLDAKPVAAPNCRTYQ